MTSNPLGITISGDSVVASDSNFTSVGGDQHIEYNIGTVVCPPPDSSSRSPPSVNDAPIDLLSVHFTGRTKELSILDDVFSVVLNDIPIRCAIHGMPGLGKTQLILRYVKMSFELGRYSHIFWISATNIDKLYQGLTKILDLVGHRDRYRQEQDAKLTSARLWLEDSHGIKWLLVLDNVDRSTLGFLREHLPRKNSKGNILFTTRTADVAEGLVNVGGESHRTLELGTLELRETTNLLLEDAGINPTIATPAMITQAEELVGSVGRLTLAVVQAASFMKQTHTPLDTILDLYKNDQKIEVIRWENDLTPYEQRSVAKAFTNQFDRLNDESGNISNLMKMLSFLDPENIPVKMVIDGANDWLQSQQGVASLIESNSRVSSQFRSLVTLTVSPIKFKVALRELQNLSLIEHRSSTGEPSLRIHDLIQFLMQEVAKQEETYRDWLQSSTSLLCGAFRQVLHPDYPQWWAECETFMPHIQALNQKWNDIDSSSLELIRANERIAKYLRSRGRYNEAERICQDVLERSEKQLGVDHLDTLAIVDRFADVYHYQGRYSEAEVLIKRALTGRVKQLVAGHPDIFSSMNNLGALYGWRKRYPEAEVLLKEALSGREKQLGPDHLDTILSMHDLAFVYNYQARYGEAEALYRRVLTKREDQLGTDHPDTLTTMNDLACLYHSQGRYDEAEALYMRTLVGEEKTLGANHPEFFTTMGNLASLFQLQERYDEAEPLGQRVLMGREMVLGADHPSTLSSISDLALTCDEQGRYDEAEALYNRALVGIENSLGADHPHTLTTAHNLASVYRSQKRYDEAESLGHRALMGREMVLGADHPSTLSSISDLALTRDEQGRYDEAEALYNRALVGQEKTLGPDHLDTLVTAYNLAFLYRSQESYDKAEALYKRILTGQERNLGPDHLTTLMTVASLGYLYVLQSRYDEAETLLKRALAGKETQLGTDHHDTLDTAKALAQLYRLQGRHSEAAA